MPSFGGSVAPSGALAVKVTRNGKGKWRRRLVDFLRRFAK